MRTIRRTFPLFAILVVSASVCAAQTDSLRLRIGAVAEASRATVGVAVHLLESGDTLTFGDTHRYPMQSVYKLPLAVAVLREVDAGHMSLDQTLHVRKVDLRADTWSPLRDAHPEGADVTLRELLSYTVSQSDNNTCDLLFRLMGGTGAVQRVVRDAGLRDIAIVATEVEMARDRDVQYTNWTHPSAMVRLLAALHGGTLLSDTSTAVLMRILEETSTGPNRIKGLLPQGTIVAHKTGSSGPNNEGLTAATNDVGIITLPDGRHVALAVFVADSRESNETNERVIAEIARLVCDRYTPH
jgi:beta-lactamase class A